jgi:hypothetical protein
MGLVRHRDRAGDSQPDERTAATREEAMAKFRAAWEKALELPPG